MYIFILLIVRFLDAIRIPLSIVRLHGRNPRRFLNSIVPLKNEIGRLYVGPIILGSQRFLVAFDTGSPTLWVYGDSDRCSSECDCDEHNNHCCTGDWMHTYSRSETYRSSKGKLNIRYGTGWVKGNLGFEEIILGNLSIIHEFGIANEWAAEMTDCVEKMDGILGLSLRSPILRTIFKVHHFQDTIFSFNLEPGHESLTLGELDHSRFNYLQYFPTSSTDKWLIQSNGFGISMGNISTVLHHNTGSALIDSGTSYLVFPTKAWRKFVLQVQKVRPDCSMIEEPGNGIGCDISKGLQNLPNLWVDIGSKKFIFSPEDYVIIDKLHESLELNDCTPWTCLMTIAISGTDSTRTYVLGDVFLRKYYTVFDQTNRRIGIGSIHPVNNSLLTKETSHRKSKNVLLYFIIALCIFIIFAWVAIGNFLFRKKRSIPQDAFLQSQEIVQSSIYITNSID